jgi:lactoylglutathione lyase
MKIVHTMIRVNDLDESLKFYCDGLGMKLLKKREYESGRFTNVFVGYGSEDTDAVIELTYNWDTHSYDIGNGFGHIALGVPDVYNIRTISAMALAISPSACRMFIKPVTSFAPRGSKLPASPVR